MVALGSAKDGGVYIFYTPVYGLARKFSCQIATTITECVTA